MPATRPRSPPRYGPRRAWTPPNSTAFALTVDPAAPLSPGGGALAADLLRVDHYGPAARPESVDRAPRRPERRPAPLRHPSRVRSRRVGTPDLPAPRPGRAAPVPRARGAGERE